MAQAQDTTGNQEVADRIRSVFNEYLSDLKPEPVKDRVEEVSYKYNNMYYQKEDIHFEIIGNRVAYMYMYFMQHCFVFYKVLCDLHDQPHIKAKFKKTEDALKVCCIGGGPGTELVALIIFLQKKNKLPPKVHCTIIDKDIEWQETWTKIWKNFPDKPDNFQLEVSCESCDLLENRCLPEGVLRAVSEAHIVTMITAYSHLYFISIDPNNMPRLKKILEEMTRESVMLFIEKDNEFDFENHFWKYQAEPADMTRVLEEPFKCSDGIKVFKTGYVHYSDIYRFYNCVKECTSLKPMSQCNVIANMFKH